MKTRFLMAVAIMLFAASMMRSEESSAPAKNTDGWKELPVIDTDNGVTELTKNVRYHYICFYDGSNVDRLVTALNDFYHAQEFFTEVNAQGETVYRVKFHRCDVSTPRGGKFWDLFLEKARPQLAVPCAVDSKENNWYPYSVATMDVPLHKWYIKERLKVEPKTIVIAKATESPPASAPSDGNGSTGGGGGRDK
jgi:hypothetical protein